MGEAKEEKRVLAMYDVRGIQKYIFRTAKVMDAIGASAIVEDIIMEALQHAIGKVRENQKWGNIQVDLEWFDDNGIKPYKETDENQYDIQVLFIGGGNAYIMCCSRTLCVEINKIMAKYILEQTYSLQLAVAIVDKTEDYADDYRRINSAMVDVKANMIVSKPLGALPVMKTEIKTGYPMADEDGSTETILKKKRAQIKQRTQEYDSKIFDSYVTQKGVDSNLAIIHIDGNNMGMRIRELISGESTYEKAVTKMREISYRINTSYKKVFDDMQKRFNQELNIEGMEGKNNHYFIRKILVAGDDITYVCNGKIAFSSVEYFCKQISQYKMYETGKNAGAVDSIDTNEFSVCAGIAFITSHFPFSVGYEVAEACCDSAKDYAKDYAKEYNKQHSDLTMGTVRNCIDFHICKNVHAKNFSGMRKREYVTNHGENLLRRPYMIPTKKQDEDVDLIHSYPEFKKALQYFQMDVKKNKDEGAGIPRSFSKELRNTYPSGQLQVEMLQAFFKSRGWKMPDGADDMYYANDGVKIAKWYDALEVMDLYVDVNDQLTEGREM